MKGFSLKLKVTLWHALFTVFMYMVVGSLAFYVITETTHNAAKNHLKNAVANSSDEINLEEGSLNFDEKFTYNSGGISISAYSEKGQLLFGKLTPDINRQIQFSSDSLNFKSDSEGGRYVYDLLVGIKGYGNVWVRGIASMEEKESVLRDWLITGIIILPVIFLVALLGGYLITKKGFRPINKILQTAGQINSGNDLTRRIEIGQGNDEVYEMADTFNEMFDRLQISFEKEKQFTADVSHELRTPMTVISAQCEYALTHELSEQEQEEVLTSIAAQNAKMAGIVRQLLSLTKVDNLKHTMVSETINFSELVAAVAEEQQYLADEYSIKIATNIAKNIIVAGDETMLMRLIINVVSNAVKYGKIGGEIKVILYEEKEKAICQVSDNGQGIGSEELTKIWQRFYQVEKSRNKKHNSGLGIGLPMAKAIVEAHHGSIKAESILEIGTTFTIILPILTKNK